MLGIILVYVGMVLISNGFYRLYNLKDKSLVVMNYFTGSLGLILNIGTILIGVATEQSNEWFYNSATGLLFAFTYLYIAINNTFNLDQRLYGWYSLFVAINTIPAGILCFYGVGGSVWYGVIWWLWGVLWLIGFIENIFGKNFGKSIGYFSIFEGIITAWIPGALMLLGIWK
ncbi:acid-activated urea channel [Enterococcus faecalis]|nr:acid-activated urea channel [Enterococcus faecalis]